MQWFPFLSIIGPITSNIEKDISLFLSLLKVFAMFHMRLLYHKHDEEEHVVEAISTQCKNWHRNTGLHVKDKKVE